MGWDYWNPSNVYEYDPYYTGGPYTGPSGTPQPWEARPLLFKLLNDPYYRKVYSAHMRTIIEESLDTAQIRVNIENLQSLAYNAASQDNNKVFTMNEYYNNTESAIWAAFNWGFGGILSTVNERKQFLLNHPEISLIPPQISNVYVNNGLVTAEVFNANTVEIMATTSEYNSKFNSFPMYDDGTNGDLLANDGVYTADLPFQFSGLDVKFYIRSENDDAIKLSPQRAEYEFYTYSYISNVSSIDEVSSRKLIAIKDALGKSVERVANVPLFYIYDDGSVEKRIFVK